MADCQCFWTMYNGVADPASQLEWNPFCPEHGESPIFNEIAHELDMTPYNAHLLFHGHSRKFEGWPL
jgi:hypothetical protein